MLLCLCMLTPLAAEATNVDDSLIIGIQSTKTPLVRPLDPKERAANIEWNIRQLELAETVGANCCVNISGSFAEYWDGYHPDLDTKETWELVVSNTQRIIDAVKPARTAYSLEPMPWMVPESPEQYLQLMKDVDRPAFKVHLDYCNMLNSIDRYRHASEFITRCFDLLGEHIVSIHAKDALIVQGGLPIVINEVMPGKGSIDLSLVTKLAHRLGDDTPVFVEHLDTHEEYLQAVAAMREAAKKANVPVK